MNNCIIFKRESNNFSDILNDSMTKKFRQKILFRNHLIIGSESDSNEISNLKNLLILKYSDDIVSKLSTNDYSPVDGVDYKNLCPPHLLKQRRT